MKTAQWKDYIKLTKFTAIGIISDFIVYELLDTNKNFKC